MSSKSPSEQQPQAWALKDHCIFACIHSLTAVSRGPTQGSSLLINFLCWRELHYSSVSWGTAQETKHIDKTFFVTRTLCCCSPWHTNISTHFLLFPSVLWPHPPIILVLMLIFCVGWLICKSWPPPCGQRCKDQGMKGTSAASGICPKQLAEREVGACCISGPPWLLKKRSSCRLGKDRKVGSLWHWKSSIRDWHASLRACSKCPSRRNAGKACTSSIALCLWAASRKSLMVSGHRHLGQSLSSSGSFV